MEIALGIAWSLIMLIVGALLGIFAENFIKRPKLAISGSGGGGGPGPGFYEKHITVLNEPGLFGPKVKNTTILGRSVHGNMEFGIPFDRTPAHECRARIHDKGSGEYVNMLWWRKWRKSSNSFYFTDTITLEPGKSAELMLFARPHNGRSEYFVFEPESKSANTPKMSDEVHRFDDTRKFEIVIHYFYGRKQFKTDVEVFKGFDGRLSFRTKSGRSSF